MTRPRAADDFDTIGRRQREIAAEAGKRIVGEACDCPTDHDVRGVYHKLHVPGCVAGAALHYRTMLDALADEEELRTCHQ